MYLTQKIHASISGKLLPGGFGYFTRFTKSICSCFYCVTFKEHFSIIVEKKPGVFELVSLNFRIEVHLLRFTLNC